MVLARQDGTASAYPISAEGVNDMIEVVDRQVVPVYEVECVECHSKIRYTASDVSWCHIQCPVCGISLCANTICPVNYKELKHDKSDK